MDANWPCSAILLTTPAFELGEPMKKKFEQKIFVVSLHKTMTRSTDILLSLLGYSTVHFPKFFGGENLMERVRGMERRPADVVEILDRLWSSRDAFSDIPVPGLYQSLALRWPNARFLLVTRDPYGWARSVKSHMRSRDLSPYNRIQYAPYLGGRIKKMGEVSEDELAKVHERHRTEVEAFFRDELGEPERLGIVDIRDGHPGEAICRFLGQPDRPLPKLEGRASAQDLETSRQWVAERPDKADAHYLLGKNLWAFGYTGEAKSALREALRLDPDQPKPPAFLSQMLYGSGEYREAAHLARLAVANGWVHPRLCYRGARDWFHQGRPIRGAALWARGLGQRLAKR